MSTICSSIQGKFEHVLLKQGQRAEQSRNLRNKNFVIALGIFGLAATVALFLYFLITGYYDNLDLTFLSPADGADSSLVCDQKPLPLTATFYADHNGYWNGNENFMFTRAMYRFKFTGYSTTLEKFKNQMNTDVLGALKRMAKIAKSKDLAENLLIWITGIIPFKDEYGNVQTMDMTGDVSSIFQSNSMFAFLRLIIVCLYILYH